MADGSIPETMRGILVEETGGPEVLQYRTDLPVARPIEGEILVKNEYAGVNYIDTYFRTGLYPFSRPGILGLEGEGTIVAVGSGDTCSLQAGDRVAWTSSGVPRGSGGYAEYTCVSAAGAIKMPSSLAASYGAAALIQGLTALTLVREAHAVQRNEWVLVHAAAGGTGLWLCQVLRHIGARVIGTASTKEKIELAKQHGAAWMVNYKDESFVERVNEITGGEGVGVVFDGVGKDTFEGDFDVLAPKGSLVSFGNASGDVPPFQIRKLSGKNIRLLRPRLPVYIATRQEYERYVAELFSWIEQDHMNVNVHKVYPLEEAATAHSDINERRTTGKLLLKI